MEKLTDKPKQGKRSVIPDNHDRDMQSAEQMITSFEQAAALINNQTDTYLKTAADSLQHEKALQTSKKASQKQSLNLHLQI